MPNDKAGNPSAENVAPNHVFDELKKFITNDSHQNSPEFHYNLALAYLRHNDHEKAHDEFLTALYGIPDKLDCYRQLIDCCLELRWLDVAKEYISKAQKLPKLAEHDSMNLDYLLGLVYKDTGDRKKALKLFKKIYKKDRNFKSVAREIRDIENAV